MTKKLLNNSVFSTFAVMIMVITACDTLPSYYRKTETNLKRIAWEAQAEEDEDIEAAYKAAKASCCGDETLNDEIKSLNLFCQAAKNGHKASMVEVGKMFLNQNVGRATIIPHDRSLAFTYFSIAEQNGYEHASYLRKEVLEEMDDSEFERATRLISSWPVVPCEINR